MTDTPRPDVDQDVAIFGRAMMHTLHQHAHKGSWRGMESADDWRFWREKLTEEFVEAMREMRALEAHIRAGHTAEVENKRKRVAEELVDVGDVAMMGYINCRTHTPPEPEPVEHVTCGMSPNPDTYISCTLPRGHGGQCNY